MHNLLIILSIFTFANSAKALEIFCPVEEFPEELNITNVRDAISCNQDLNDQSTLSGRDTALIKAVKEQKVDVIAALIAETGRVDLNRRNAFGKTALSLAIELGYTGISALLINAQGIDLNNNRGMSMLSLSIMHGRQEIFDILVSKEEVNLNHRYTAFNFFTPLMYAILHNREGMFHRLLNLGVELNIYGDGGNTLHVAIKNRRVSMALTLIERGVFINEKNNLDQTPLMMAIEENLIQVINALVSHAHIAPNLRQRRDGNTALILAVQASNEEAVRALLAARRINLNLRNMAYDTALTIARGNDDLEIVEILESARGIDLGKVNIFSSQFNYVVGDRIIDSRGLERVIGEIEPRVYDSHLRRHIGGNVIDQEGRVIPFGLESLAVTHGCSFYAEEDLCVGRRIRFIGGFDGVVTGIYQDGSIAFQLVGQEEHRRSFPFESQFTTQGEYRVRIRE